MSVGELATVWTAIIGPAPDGAAAEEVRERATRMLVAVHGHGTTRSGVARRMQDYDAGSPRRSKHDHRANQRAARHVTVDWRFEPGQPLHPPLEEIGRLEPNNGIDGSAVIAAHWDSWSPA